MSTRASWRESTYTTLLTCPSRSMSAQRIGHSYTWRTLPMLPEPNAGAGRPTVGGQDRCRASGTRLGGAQAGAQHLEESLADLGLLVEDRVEGPGGQCDRRHRRLGLDRGGPRLAVDHGDLAEVVAGTQRGPAVAMDRHRCRSLADQVEAGRPATLLGDLLAGFMADHASLGRDRLECLVTQPVEQVGAAQRLDDIRICRRH